MEAKGEEGRERRESRRDEVKEGEERGGGEMRRERREWKTHMG